jgi:hypothetical protein
MDPYLERPGLWAGFHVRLYNAISTALNRTLPPGYFADIDEYVWLAADDPTDRRRLGKPDAFVTDRNGASGSPRGGGAVAVAPSVETTLPKTRKKARKYVRIVAPDHRTVVTVVEVLSPSNKGGDPDDRANYLAKREEYLATGTSLVEIDLLRDGERMPLGKPSPPAADYYVFVCRGRGFPKARVWPFTVRDPIPPFAVPLRPGDPDLALALGPLVADIYDTNRYADRVDYAQPLAPALRKADAEWAAELLKKHAKRRKK